MKKIMMGFIISLTAITLVGCISIPIGDGNSLKLSTDGIEVTGEDGESTKISVDEDEGSVSMTGTDEDGNKTEFSQKGGQEIPEDFPDDIPIPSDATITAGVSTKVDGSHGMNVGYIIEGEDDVTGYLKMYVDYAEKAGYEVQAESNYGDSAMINAVRDDKEMLGLMVSETEEGLDVTVTYQIHSEEE